MHTDIDVKFFTKTCRNLKASEINELFTILDQKVKDDILVRLHSAIAAKGYAMRELGLRENVQSLVDYGDTLLSSVGILSPKD